MAMTGDRQGGSRALEAWIGDRQVAPAGGWTLEWRDRAAGIGRLIAPGQTELVVVEGRGSEWVVTLRGRRVAVSVRTWRERLLAEAEQAAAGHAGPVEVRATLPGLVVVVETGVGSQVAEGDRLLTIEAMKMQNEVRAPRPGRIREIAVRAGQAVTTGQLLLRIE